MSDRKRILVVDDDAFIRRPLEFILREEGYEPQTAVDAADAMKKIDRSIPDLIFLDVMMPGQDGLSVCAALKGDPRFSHIPIILLSARGQESDRQRGLALGAADFFTKPYSPSDLLLRVREVLDEA